MNHPHLKNDAVTIDSCTPHSHELNLLHKKFENFYKKFSSPVHNISKKRHTATLSASIHQWYETPTDSRMKPDFQTLHLHNFQPNKRKRSRGISFSRDSLDKHPDYQENPEERFLNLPRTRI